MNDIKNNIFHGGGKRMHLKVLGPDINESAYMFNVNKKGEIRFGLGAIKGVAKVVENIVNERLEMVILTQFMI